MRILYSESGFSTRKRTILTTITSDERLLHRQLRIFLYAAATVGVAGIIMAQELPMHFETNTYGRRNSCRIFFYSSSSSFSSDAHLSCCGHSFRNNRHKSLLLPLTLVWLRYFSEPLARLSVNFPRTLSMECFGSGVAASYE